MLALNGALLTIQNGIAVLFPAWIRLGPAVSTGVEALGQNVLATVANLFTCARPSRCVASPRAIIARVRRLACVFGSCIATERTAGAARDLGCIDGAGGA